MSTLVESLRLLRAGERLGFVMDSIDFLSGSLTKVVEIAPDLDPEVRAIRAELDEAVDHLRAALTVLQTKVDLL